MHFGLINFSVTSYALGSESGKADSTSRRNCLNCSGLTHHEDGLISLCSSRPGLFKLAEQILVRALAVCPAKSLPSSPRISLTGLSAMVAARSGLSENANSSTIHVMPPSTLRCKVAAFRLHMTLACQSWNSSASPATHCTQCGSSPQGLQRLSLLLNTFWSKLPQDVFSLLAAVFVKSIDTSADLYLNEIWRSPQYGQGESRQEQGPLATSR
mmetsp:Transcript_130562/g.325761  ORF Transcript_130562/g.325761 Transcript_130562/m.325761 type:complete len:213 (+) Transcript_130562:605-1243(+)